MSVKKFVIKATTYDKKGKVISVAENNYKKTHPLMQHFGAKVGLHEKLYLHAEVLALVRAGEKKVHSIYVERYNADGSPALAKPCPICAKAIKAWGVSNVFYTDKE